MSTPAYTYEEMMQVIAEATVAIQRATEELAELRRQVADKDALIASISAERDHWYGVSIGGN